MLKKKSQKKAGHLSRGCLLASHQNESPGRTVARTNPGFRVWGSSWCPTENPPVRPYFKKTTIHKKELLRFFGAETPNASRNRY